MTYWDYDITMTKNGIEFDEEITLQSLKKYHDFNEGDLFLLVVLNGKVCLIKKNEEQVTYSQNLPIVQLDRTTAF